MYWTHDRKKGEIVYIIMDKKILFVNPYPAGEEESGRRDGQPEYVSSSGFCIWWSGFFSGTAF